jgi:hypothetical protein
MNLDLRFIRSEDDGRAPCPERWGRPPMRPGHDQLAVVEHDDVGEMGAAHADVMEAQDAADVGVLVETTGIEPATSWLQSGPW